MAIRFHLPDDGLDRVAFAYSPLLETVLSLHVLVEPKHHPLQHPWVREMRRLSPRLKRRVTDFSFVYRRLVPDVFCPPADAGFRSFDEEVELVRGLEAHEIGLEFLRPLFDHGGRRDAALLESAEVRAHVERVTRRSGGDVQLARLIFDDPLELARRFTDFVEAYWRDAFREEWERLEPQLADTVSSAGRAIAAGGVYALVRTLAPRLVVDEEREEFGRQVPHDHRIEVTPENRVLFVPSAFVWPHVFVNCDAPWPLSVVYPPPFVSGAARPPLPSAELLRVLRALGDDTRLRALRLISERPRSTQELAPLVGISEAGLSKHLRALAAAGLVRTKREGYYVLYSLEPDRLEPLSAALLEFLGRA